MLFNSIDFLIIFLPITFVIFHTVPRQFRLIVLIAASFIFYASSGLVPFYFMCLSILWGFATAYLFRSGFPRSLATIIAVSFPLWVLFMFRYLDFTLDNFGVPDSDRDSVAFFLEVLLPAGISFYTFQIISYTLDVRDNRIPRDPNLIHVTAYISFFPQLIAGPIVRYSRIKGQLERLTRVDRVTVNTRLALKLITVGLAVKVIIVDRLALYTETLDIAANDNTLDFLYVIFAYSFQIYYDFWAYSTIALGLGRLFGIVLPRNFREPYMSLNPRDFWRRWHMTLSYWLRDYVYLKLGGNKNYTRNILIVFAAVGLWHGAGWNFIIWGLYHAVFVLLYTATRPIWNRIPPVLQIGLTFVIVSFGWPLFFLDAPTYWYMLSTMFQFSNFGFEFYRPYHWVFLALVATWCFTMRETVWLFNRRPRLIFDNPVSHASLLFVTVLLFDWSRTFIYFRF